MVTSKSTVGSPAAGRSVRAGGRRRRCRSGDRSVASSVEDRVGAVRTGRGDYVARRALRAVGGKEARVGFGSRIGSTLRLSRARMRRVVTVLVVLTVAAATGATVSLTAPAMLVEPGPGRAAGDHRGAAAGPARARRAVRHRPAADRGRRRGHAGRRGARRCRAGSPGSCWTPPAATRCGPRSPDRALVPGSTGKLLTAAAALLTLPPDRARSSPGWWPGPDPGTVVLVGGGDPTLTALPAGRDGVYPDAPRLAELADAGQAGGAGADHPGAGRHRPLHRPDAGRGLGRGRHRGRLRRPDRAADGRRRPDRRARCRTARGWRTRR